MGAEQSQMDPMYMKAGLTKEEVSFHTYRPRACRTSLFTVFFFFLFLRRVRLRPSYPSYFLHRRLFLLKSVVCDEMYAVLPYGACLELFAVLFGLLRRVFVAAVAIAARCPLRDAHNKKHPSPAIKNNHRNNTIFNFF